MKRKTWIPFQMFQMDIETLKKYEDYAKPLTENDKKRLMQLEKMELPDEERKLITYTRVTPNCERKRTPSAVREIAIIIMKKAVTAVMVRRVKSLAARAAAADATAAVEHQSQSWKARM